MNTKAMEAAKEITNLREIEMYTAEEIAAIISKHFPEPSVSVSELKEMLSMEWMQNKTDVEQLQKHLEAIAWRPDGRGDPECVDQAAAMSNDVIRLLLLPLIDKIAKASAQEKP